MSGLLNLARNLGRPDETLRLIELGVCDVRKIETGAAEHSAAQVGADEIRIAEVSHVQSGFFQIRDSGG